jgi:hypothetical protein
MLWVGGNKISKPGDVPVNAAATKPYIADGNVRDFHDWDEARAFAAGNTDYIGNLVGPTEPGTWMRFSPPAVHPPVGLNVVGETHNYLPLVQTVAAVRARSFIYEQFATDALPANSAFRAAYLVENTALLQAFNVNLGSDLTLVGGESLLPKIADTVAELVPYFNKTEDMTDMTSGGNRWLGKPDQRYVKIGWGWAKDLAAGPTATAAEAALAHAVNTHRAILDQFITGLPVDGFLGDPLMLPANDDKYAPLLALCQAYVPVMIERAHNDQALTGQERQALQTMPTGTVDEQQDMFALWRNLYFAKATADAAARNVRYAGMGDAHRKWLEQNNRVPASAHVYQVTAVGLQAFIDHTTALRNS